MPAGLFSFGAGMATLALENKSVVIIGGTSGLGFSAARAFLAAVMAPGESSGSADVSNSASRGEEPGTWTLISSFNNPPGATALIVGGVRDTKVSKLLRACGGCLGAQRR